MGYLGHYSVFEALVDALVASSSARLPRAAHTWLNISGLGDSEVNSSKPKPDCMSQRLLHISESVLRYLHSKQNRQTAPWYAS